MSAKPSYAVIGAGIGGLAVAALLARQGAKVTIYEQAREFLRIGAGIQMSPMRGSCCARSNASRRCASLRLAALAARAPATGNRDQFSRSSRM